METPSFVGTDVRGIRPVFRMIARDMNLDGDLDLVVSNGDFHTLENTIEQLPPVSIFTPAQHEVTVYPNPVADDYLLLNNVPHAANVVFELLDLNGRMVLRGKLGTNHQIDMRGVARGTYVVRLLDNQVVWGSTLVVKQ
ncbi:MAG: T9SS type A sorting domain-containing protein [Lewinella sp.]